MTKSPERTPEEFVALYAEALGISAEMSQVLVMGIAKIVQKSEERGRAEAAERIAALEAKIAELEAQKRDAYNSGFIAGKGTKIFYGGL